MTREETEALVRKIRLAWPGNVRIGFAEQVRSWHEVTRDYPAALFETALRAFRVNDARGFAPSPGQLIAMMKTLSGADPEIDAQQRWQLVRERLRDCSMAESSRRFDDRRTSAERAFDALPPDVRAAVGSPRQLADWANCPAAEVDTVIASMFLRAYRARRERELRLAALPENVRKLLSDVGAAVCLAPERETGRLPSACPREER